MTPKCRTVAIAILVALTFSSLVASPRASVASIAAKDAPSESVPRFESAKCPFALASARSGDLFGFGR